MYKPNINACCREDDSVEVPIESGGGRLDFIRLHAGEELGVDIVELGDNKEGRDISLTGLWA